ncbi:hypothetical protein BDM02DRAFT_3109979 [Thelephora ganbajun]|uniref:Uncharacterized protein n=1 Tax=Thelephora ganbajun TaxID=370292 RepID=A0ACB6ZRW7_THEGA|nr:hypothetical protein BDM02DRAFT_3109979 [Thelephora ganbajun]
MPSVLSFFQNKGAVAGVFVVVGLATTAIAFFVLFWFRRRRKTRRLDHDAAVAATLAEHGYGRQSLIDADDDHPASDPRAMATPSGSGSSADMRASTPSMTLGGFNPGPVSAGGYGRQSHDLPYLADSLGHAYNPYTDNEVQHRNASPGQSNSGGMPSFSLPSVPGVGRPFFGHGPKDSMGSSEPLLGANSGSDTPPEPATPVIPPRNPLRLLGGAGDRHSSNTGHGDGGSSNDEDGGYRDDDDFEYEALRKRSLKVRNNPD